MAVMRTGFSSRESRETRTTEKPAANRRLRTSATVCSVVKRYSPAARQAAVHALQVLGRGIGLQAVDEVAAPRDVDPSPRAPGMRTPSHPTSRRLHGARRLCASWPDTSTEYTRST
jgi:hypothetical protein